MPVLRFPHFLALTALAALSPAAFAVETSARPAAPVATGTAQADQAAAPAKTVPAITKPGALSMLRQLDEEFVGVFNKVAPSVVVIDGSRKPKSDDADEPQNFFFRAPSPRSGRDFRLPDAPNFTEASGFIIRQDGYIVTNNHAIAGADRVNIRLKDGRQFPGKVVGADERTDIAVIKIEATQLPTLTLADSDAVRIGQIVCAIGIPYRLEYSFTVGFVSGKGRSNLENRTTYYEDYIQTDASINPGNSGGPLFNVDGDVVGMNTLINNTAQGLAFAIPSKMVRQISDELIANGRIVRPWLGIRIETLGDEESLRDQIKGVEKGVVVNTIEPNAPVANSDLRPADVITAVDGVPVTTAQELQKLVLTKKIGKEVALSVWRGGKSITVPVTPGELPQSPGARNLLASEEPKVESKISDAPHGLKVADIDKATADRLGLRQTTGVIVTDVAPESAASVAGIQKDDVITEIDSKAVASAEDARGVLSKSDPTKRAILLFLERKGQKTYAVLKLDK